MRRLNDNLLKTFLNVFNVFSQMSKHLVPTLIAGSPERQLSHPLALVTVFMGFGGRKTCL